MFRAATNTPSKARRAPVVPSHLVTGSRPSATRVPVLGYFVIVGAALIIGLVALSARLEATPLPQGGKSLRTVSSAASVERLLPSGSHVR